MNYDVLFTPYKIGRMEVKNRIVMSPMGTLMANRDGTFSENEIAYYEERARGGTGMIICGQGYLNSDFGQGVLGHAWDHYHVVPAARGLTERLHAYDCKAVMQLSCGTGRNANEIHGKLPISASENPWVWDPSVKCHALTIEEIADMMKLWEYSAGLVRDAGFDAIEVHAHVGYLVDQFLSPIWNKRTDEYGGSPENRTRFATDIVDAIHRGAGKDFPVIFRLSLDHRIPGGRTLEDSIPILKVLDEHGCDAFNVDAGCYETIKYVYPPMYMGEASMEYVCAGARAATKKPILNAGSHTPESAVHMIESGHADFAIFGRQLIADPELGSKLLQNRPEDVRPCMRCNEECIGRIIRYRTKLSCAVNPATGDENAMRLYKTDDPKNVVVIGGGLVGCELAVYLTEEKGYTDVTVIEGANELMSGGYEPMPLPNKLMLIDLMKFHGVKVLTSTMLDHIDGNKVYVKRSGEVSALETDSVVMSIGFNANDELYREINENIPKKVWLLGDAKMPSNIMFGIRDANAIAREI